MKIKKKRFLISAVIEDDYSDDPKLTYTPKQLYREIKRAIEGLNTTVTRLTIIELATPNVQEIEKVRRKRSANKS